jgi:copper resistance protein C
MPENTPAPRPFARALAAAAATMLLVTGGLLAAAPASAHDELVSTDPAADSAVASLPDELTLTFSGELATDPAATELQITDADGTDLADGEPVIDGTLLAQPLAGAASGEVTVLWKVVSSDGHPISGEFAFSVTAPSTPTPASTEPATAAPPPTTVPTQEPAPEPTPTPTVVPVESGAQSLPWILFAVLGVAVLGAVTYLLVSRARRERDLAPAPGGTALGAPDGGAAPRSEPPADR